MPQVFFGPFDERNNDYAFENNANFGRFPLGHNLILPDGREYKFTLNDGTVEVAGNLYQSVAELAGHTDQLVMTAAAVGDRSLEVNLDTTIAEVDIYAEGIVHINDSQANTGEGYAYRISRAFTAEAAHASAASTANITVNLAAGETIQVALDTAAQATLTRNRYHQALIHDSPPTAQLTGVSPGVAAANRFYWSQVKGYAAVATDLTLLAGLPIMPSIAQDGQIESYKRRMRTGGATLTRPTTIVGVASKVLDQDGTTTNLEFLHTVSTAVTITADVSGPAAINGPVIGQCIKSNASTEFALVDLMIP